MKTTTTKKQHSTKVHRGSQVPGLFPSCTNQACLCRDLEPNPQREAKTHRAVSTTMARAPASRVPAGQSGGQQWGYRVTFGGDLEGFALAMELVTEGVSILNAKTKTGSNPKGSNCKRPANNPFTKQRTAPFK